MSVFRQLELTYKGEVLTFTPSLAMLRGIKAKGVNNVVLANRCITGGLDLEDLIIPHVAILAEAGVTISDEESYFYLSGGGNQEEIVSFQMAYAQSVLPAVDFGKKDADQDAKP